MSERIQARRDKTVMEITTDNYWDCSCETNYIHPKSQDFCSKCGAISYLQPDSIKSEVQLKLKTKIDRPK